MKKKLIFVANPNAGRMCFFSPRPVLDFVRTVERELTGWNISVLFANDQQQLKASLARIAPDSIGAIFTLGGDGTLNRCLDTLLDLNRQGVPIGILPAGTANDLASELGMELSIDCVARAVESGRRRAIDVLRVNGKPLVTVGGAGVGSLLLDEVERSRQGRGRMLTGLLHSVSKSEMYSVLAMKGILLGPIDPVEEDSFTYRLRATNSEHGSGRPQIREFTTSAMFVCNQGRLGGNLSVSPQSATDDGVFEMLALNGGGRMALLRLLLDLKLGRKPANTLTLSSHSLLIEEMDGRPISFFGDGEVLLRESRLRLWVEPGQLDVLSLAPSLKGRTDTIVEPLAAAA